MLRRAIPSFLIVSLLCAINPARVPAMSTAAEIQMGQQEDQQIVAGSVIETDPLLNAYVSGIAENLWNQVARKDVPYSVKIIKDNDINSFATMGGFVYIYEGLIDFVQSDDELASVMGHETGHIERRHVITTNSKAEILNILFGIASMFSPLIYDFGGLAEAGIMAKISREDELQADRYGLQLMSRAGYDPDSMVTMMSHLAELGDEHNDLVSKYLEDHPDPSARVAHLVGYPELDPKVVTPAQQVVQASSDEERARYDFASVRLNDVLKSNPQNPEALLELGQSELALGLTSKSEQTLAEAAQLGSAQTRATANASITSLRRMEAERVTLTHPNLPKLQSAMAAAQASQIETATEIQARAQEGHDQLKAINSRISSLEYEIPDFSRIDIRRGSRVEAIVKNLTLMSRSINSALQDAGNPIGGVGSLEKNKESGLLKEGADIYAEMQSPFTMTPIPADSLALLPSYPQMLEELSLANGDMVRSVDAARASLTMLDQSIGDLDEFLKIWITSTSDSTATSARARTCSSRRRWRNRPASSTRPRSRRRKPTSSTIWRALASSRRASPCSASGSRRSATRPFSTRSSSASESTASTTARCCATGSLRATWWRRRFWRPTSRARPKRSWPNPRAPANRSSTLPTRTECMRGPSRSLWV